MASDTEDDEKPTSIQMYPSTVDRLNDYKTSERKPSHDEIIKKILDIVDDHPFFKAQLREALK